MRLLTTYVLLLSFIGAAFSAQARAKSAPECYEFKNLNNPAGIEQSEPESEQWCYQKESFLGKDALFIFNVDSGLTRAEMSALVVLSPGEPAQLMSLASRTEDKIRYHALKNLSLNPFIAPLDLSEARRTGKAMSSLSLFSAALGDEQVLHSHWLTLLNEDKLNDPQAVQAGDFNVSVPESAFPFNAFWWSTAGQPMSSGPNSPLGIYDAGVAARTGTNPQSVDWEQKNHFDTGTSWGGHCNGWAASTSLYAEPTQTLYDPYTQTLITPYAQKGMLAEASFCVNQAFYGNRYNYPSDDLYDMRPDLFHQVLTYYIQYLGKTVITDYDRTAMVDNNIITAYRFHIERKSQTASTQTFHVNTVLTLAQYDVEQRDSLGKAGTYEKSYAYTLTTDKNGTILSGKWDQTSDNPDFMWVPLSASESCAARNPRVHPSEVAALLKSLKPVQLSELSIAFAVNQTLMPQGQITVPLKIKAADHMKLQVTVDTLTPNLNLGALLIVSGNARYPVTGGEKESLFIHLNAGEQVLSLDRLLSIDSAAIVNQSQSVSAQVKLTISTLQGFTY